MVRKEVKQDGGEKVGVGVMRGRKGGRALPKTPPGKSRVSHGALLGKRAAGRGKTGATADERVTRGTGTDALQAPVEREAEKAELKKVPGENKSKNKNEEQVGPSEPKEERVSRRKSKEPNATDVG